MTVSAKLLQYLIRLNTLNTYLERQSFKEKWFEAFRSTAITIFALNELLEWRQTVDERCGHLRYYSDSLMRCGPSRRVGARRVKHEGSPPPTGRRYWSSGRPRRWRKTSPAARSSWVARPGRRPRPRAAAIEPLIRFASPPHTTASHYRPALALRQLLTAICATPLFFQVPFRSPGPVYFQAIPPRRPIQRADATPTAAAAAAATVAVLDNFEQWRWAGPSIDGFSAYSTLCSRQRPSLCIQCRLLGFPSLSNYFSSSRCSRRVLHPHPCKPSRRPHLCATAQSATSSSVSF